MSKDCIKVKKALNRRLSKPEFEVIENKGTEPPFSGSLLHESKAGFFVCARCYARLYKSVSKFDSGCGWPAFDKEVPKAVTKQTDKDGRRVEILCSACNAHLGHVFEGEGFTPQNTRHCVNSLSMKFVPLIGETGRAVFAGGCFWGVECLIKKMSGVVKTTVGYTGGHTHFPTYQDVLSQKTGHYEAVEVFYDTTKTSFEALVTCFFEIHDPTQVGGQGPDRGEQYLSIVFYENNSQKESAKKCMQILKSNGYDLATKLLPAGSFWPAEEYHQKYYEKNGQRPYCHRRISRF
ncbi:MAG TPA: bifunctional methionine sulfoxide reductase B/A protein [Treponemataceae bacterium]|nr:bifunctional methionine sulfoxide reductase B/A protein [Treponemataceae bacterium]